MTDNSKIASTIQVSLGSLTGIDDAATQFQTLSSIQLANSYVPEHAEAQNPIPSTGNSTNFVSSRKKLKRAASSLPSLTNLDGLYDRLEKFFDKEGLHIAYLSPTNRRQTILKPCAALDPNPNFRIRSNTEEIVQDKSLNRMKSVAMPSFLAKRASIQRSMSETKNISETESDNVIKSSLLKSAVVQTSKFKCCEQVDQEGDNEKKV